TTSQNQTAVLGCHAGTEAVVTSALQIAGLECSFHETEPVCLDHWRGIYPHGVEKRRDSKETCGVKQTYLLSLRKFDCAKNRLPGYTLFSPEYTLVINRLIHRCD